MRSPKRTPGRTGERENIAVLGAGNMGSALVSGLLASGLRRPSQITVTDVDGGRRAALEKKFGLRTTPDNRDAARIAGVIVLCVKPQQVGAVLQDLAGVVPKASLVISVAAGVPTGKIEKALGPIPVIRAMPNTPALLRAGAMVFSLGRHARAAHERAAREILSALGPVWKVAENRMDAVTALSGSGPAYVFYLAECLAEAGRSLGLDAALAQGLARQTVFGAGRMLAELPEPAAELRRRVTSPGGTTEAALSVLIQADLPGIFRRALAAAGARSAALAKISERPAL